MGNATQQRLIQPLNNMRTTASYKNPAYKANLGLGEHYGLDCADLNRADTQVWGMGNGTVLDTGFDSCFGNYIVVKYPQALNRKENRYADLIVRMFHFDSVSVKKDQEITKDTRMGKYGSTGTYATAAHLHIEVDEDTVYTHYTPTITKSTSKFKGTDARANDLTMSNPMHWIHCKTSAPDNQTYATNNDPYINAEDKTPQPVTSI